MKCSRAALLCAVLTVWIAGHGCFGSEVARRTVDLNDFRSWAGQETADSLAAGVISVASAIPEVSGGGFQGLEEMSLFVQLQNQDFDPTEISIYATDRSYSTDAEIRANGVRILRPLLVSAQTAIQIDARNYPQVAEGFEEFNALVAQGDVYLWVVGSGDTYRVGANVPSVSMLVVFE